jgi:hypothetical protein
MLKTLLAAITAFVTGVALTSLKKDNVILELQRDIARLKSFENYSSIFRPAYDHGYNRGWLDRNMSPEPPARWNR